MTNKRFAKGREWIGRHWGKLFVVQAILLVIAGYLLASWDAAPASVSAVLPAPAKARKESAKPQIWTCSMHPQIRRDGPGKCPLCGMALVPVTASAGGLRTLTLSPEARALLNIETVPVERRYVEHKLEMVGKVAYDETRLGFITAWVNGRLDRLFVNFTGVPVKKGDHMVYIYSEDLYSAQEEMLQAIKYGRQRGTTRILGGVDLAQSAREKLRNLGLTDAQIKEVEARGTPSYHMTIYAPVSGVVIKKLREEGDRVRIGDRIYTIADLNHLWVHLDAYESDLQWVRYGQHVTFTTEAYPGEVFSGRVAFIQPVMDDQTRTIKVRVNVDNTSGKLKPAMFVRALIRSEIASGGRVMDPDLAGKWICPMHPEIVKDHPGECDDCGMPLVRAESLGYVAAEADDAAKPLVVPASAVLLTGTRAVVYVEDPKADQPTFNGREIVLGPRAGDYYIVRSGLAAGELVVTHGNFKIDSEIQIQAKPSMMTPEGGGGGGHHHGGSAEKKKGTMAGMVEISAAFKEQLGDVVHASEQVVAALKQADLTKIRRTFGAVGNALNSVNANGLKEHVLMQWNELSMLLTNDVVEGKSVKTMTEAQRVARLLAGHIQRVVQTFGLQNLPPRPRRLAVPASFQIQLGRLWMSYLPIQGALAADNLADAQRAAALLQRAVATIDGALLKGIAQAAWAKEQKNLGRIMQQLGKARDIEAFRTAFAMLSDELKALIVTFGMKNVGRQYELHCPMAFGGRGAIWFQSDDQIKNPYYGAAMLSCADRVKRLEADDNTQEEPK